MPKKPRNAEGAFNEESLRIAAAAPIPETVVAMEQAPLSSKKAQKKQADMKKKASAAKPLSASRAAKPKTSAKASAKAKAAPKAGTTQPPLKPASAKAAAKSTLKAAPSKATTGEAKPVRNSGQASPSLPPENNSQPESGKRQSTATLQKQVAASGKSGVSLSAGGFITEYDLYLLQEGNHFNAYEKMGAHTVQSGVHFGVWAPNASAVSVVGDFNEWDGNKNPLSPLGSSGIWAGIVPGIGAGELYKYELHDRNGYLLPLKSDPYGFFAEVPPHTASIVSNLPEAPKQRSDGQTRRDPVSIYEVHLASWRRAEDNRILTYRELAETLVPYAKDMGFTHLEFMPVSEHPFNGSWGYQPIGLFSPTSRFGTPDDFRYLVDQAHAAGLKVLLDWVPGHFPNDAHGLAYFDGTDLYNHADPRQGMHQDWGTFIYNFGRAEVRQFLLSNALYWADRFGIDGLRVDAVASMLYLDYSRKAGEWIPNQYGGRENLEATAFLRRMNELFYERFPSGITVAEESTAWPGVSQPVYNGGLGFGFKWNMGWMHDTLDYIANDPIYRKYHHHQLTFGLLYAWSENFILPISHDEVVHGKGSLLARMPGDEWQKFANYRSYLGFMFSHPGKKLLFMGCEFAQGREWNHDQSLDWHQIDEHWGHRGVQALVRDLNRVYRENPAMHVLDCEAAGFEWLESDAADAGVLAYMRKGEGENDIILAVCNFTPVHREGHRIPAPKTGFYEEILNTDAEIYGGGNRGNMGGLHTIGEGWHERPDSLVATLPPLSAIYFRYRP